jgi:hypothetical protein
MMNGEVAPVSDLPGLAPQRGDSTQSESLVPSHGFGALLSKAVIAIVVASARP